MWSINKILINDTIKLPTIISTLSALLTILLTSWPTPTSAMPTLLHPDKTRNTPQTRSLGGILICNGPNASQACAYNIYEMETCYNLPQQFFRNTNTFALDEGEWYCYPYIMSCREICTSPEGCTLGGVSSQYEHKFNLSAVGWDHYISSFECHLGVAPSVP
ncbi:hypothetical protein GE21DRAFT_4470 [Neurospora crassa]|uniref:Uncharacterized protein n=1 Tax=Neurospora crassa (strain ATCC 24698 / 74-OR23-1A / CBS 708.71 / DSM 1257 / FGSC 987) TaxID=367110 RepID=U9W4X1_NEUCR|nr:hypothetical protein NCU16664 [Neurospora crassa OR74A]ESA43294.1 hypothetical protein NCU16664 [Neurospora crassa OR74A]KHE89417.1 hypothetical protein GE21DRAFT_4470 [Neurospora crassa]|eukprot:XP_011394045.1 hypothetical protein NCU16664 [Neurospora crassa OR74A]